MSSIDVEAFLAIAFPALHSDEGPPFASDAKLQVVREFRSERLVKGLVRWN